MKVFLGQYEGFIDLINGYFTDKFNILFGTTMTTPFF